MSWLPVQIVVPCRQGSTTSANFEYQPNGSSVSFKMKFQGNVACPNFRMNWTVNLQRYTNEGDNVFRWVKIGTRSGYVENGSPSDRTFTNISKQNKSMRLVIYTSDASTGKDLGTFLSNQWTY